MNKILLGYSVWSYKDCVGPFYKAEKASRLKACSEVFKTTEINSVFYAYPSKGTAMGWLKYTNTTLVISPAKPLFFAKYMHANV